MSCRLLLAPFLMACSLAACAVGPDTSYVSSVLNPADVAVIAAGIGSFVRTQLPAASTTIRLDPTPFDQSGNALTSALANKLRERGFAVTEGDAPQGGHTLRYWVTALDDSGELVRLRIDGQKEASQFFVRNTAGGLQSGGPFTVMQIGVSL